MEVWKMIFRFNWVIFGFYVNFQGCKDINHIPETNSSAPTNGWLEYYFPILSIGEVSAYFQGRNC